MKLAAGTAALPGEKAEAIVASMTAVAEGYSTARKHGVETPIIEEVYAMLYESMDVRQAVQDLTARESKAED